MKKEKTKKEEQKQEEPKVMSVQTSMVDPEIDYKDKYLHLLADIDNIRKNSAKQISAIRETANEKIVRDLVPFIDALESAIKNKVVGADVLLANFLFILGQYGVKELNVKIGDKFDENWMEAISTIPNGDIEKDKTVYDVFRKGYALNGTVIRYAQVVVNVLNM